MKSKTIYLIFILLATVCWNCQESNKKTVYTPHEEEETIDSLNIITDILQEKITNNPDWNPHAVRYGFEDWINTPAVDFVLDWKTEKDSITVWLSVNREETIAGFRKEIINSSLVHFRKSSPRIPLAKHYSSGYKDAASYGYELKLSQDMFTFPLPSTITATIFNYTDIDATTGTRYWVDYNNNGTWEVIDFVFNNGYLIGFPDIGYSLLSHSKHEHTIPLYPDLYDYQPGEYRIRRGFLIDGHYTEKGQSRIWKDYFVAASFIIHKINISR